MSEIKLTFPGNLSWSAFNLFRDCERHFFYAKILKCPISDRVETKWGRFGNCVHDAIENADNPNYSFDDFWIKYKMFDTDMSKEIALECVERALRSATYKNLKHKERKVEFPWRGMNVKLIIDAEENDGSIVDWKTSTFDRKKVNDYRQQTIWYAWGIWKKTGIVPPKVKVMFVKYDMPVFEWEVKIEELQKFELHIIEVLEQLQTKKEFDDYRLNNKSCFFCGFKKKCRADSIQKKENLVFNLEIDHDYVQIKTDMQDNFFDNTLSDFFSYEIDNSYFVKKAMAKRGVKNFDGVVRMYKDGKVPIGFYHKLKELLKQYGEYANKMVIIYEKDKRVFNKTQIATPHLNDVELRPYQKAAVKHIINSKISMTEIATGAGKTVMAAEIIKTLGNKTLFVVDRNILLTQTKKVFEDYGLRFIGSVTAGKQSWGDVTIASIQTLTQLIKKKDKEVLRQIGLCDVVIVDEAHGAKSKSYQTLMKHVGAEYRIGLTGTAYADGNSSLELYKSFGFPDYKITNKELIDSGHLTPCECTFLKYEAGHILNGDYSEVYDQILKVEYRLRIVEEICATHKHDNTLIMVDKIEHIIITKELLKQYNIHVIQGATNIKERDTILKTIKSSSGNILIATSQIIQKGVDIPNLDVIINYTANLGTVKTRQSLGRVLRTSKGKDKAYYYDFYDEHPTLKKHTHERIKTLEEQGFDVTIK